MVRTRMRKGKKSTSNNSTVVPNDMYTYDSLPDDRKKKFDSILEDFDKELEDRIEASNTEMHSLCVSIRNAYRVALFQLPKQQRDLNQEDLVLKKKQEKENGSVVSRESEIFSTELAKVAENVASTVNNKVKAVKKSAKKSEETKSAIKRKANVGPLTSTACSNRGDKKVPNVLPNVSPVVAKTATTPMLKNTPINRQLRLGKPNEIGMSLNGSPFIVAETITPSKEAAFDAASTKANLGVTWKLANNSSVQESTFDEDMEALSKIESLRNQIDSMMKMKDQ